MPAFKDNFSQQAAIYAQYRPHYPVALYEHLASLTSAHETVWDCGTGNGQAAVGLTAFYNRVIATDPSEEQINNSTHHERIVYKIERAEQTSISDHSIDLLTTANALHWFNFDEFYNEARRVLKPGGIIAAWCYEVPFVTPGIDKIVRHYHDHTLNDYWQYENRLVEKAYTTIPFPFELIDSPSFTSEKMMDLDTFIAYLNTWSATQRYINDKGMNPTEQLRDELRTVWPVSNKALKVTWKLILKTGRV
ncbi:MAG: Trans-aconitate methyltransferase [Flavipsychrobacter sp.]|nr:Trans-aconitate methyltransferase [Flavipsychrobacter sp.]